MTLAQTRPFYLPKLCKNTSVLGAIIITELVAIVFALLTSWSEFVIRLGLISLYLQWLTLSVLCVLCLSREIINRRPSSIRFWIVFAVILLVFLLVEVSSQWIIAGEVVAIELSRLSSHLVIAAIVGLAFLRLLHLGSVLEQRNKAEAESRIQALQSRIRPHFLFNSLNTIAELTATSPTKAEEAIQSLSMLFRAGLESDQGFHSLSAELSLCERYLSLEQWRLSDHLQVDWQVNVQNAAAYRVPKLILQPLIENAVVHGRRDDGTVELSIDVRESRKDLSIVVENTKAEAKFSVGSGHGIAVNNIRERLIVLYDDQQTLRIRDNSDRYRVLMRFPKNPLNT